MVDEIFRIDYLVLLGVNLRLLVGGDEYLQ